MMITQYKIFNGNSYWHEFQFDSNNWDAQLASVTYFQVLESRNQVTLTWILHL